MPMIRELVAGFWARKREQKQTTFNQQKERNTDRKGNDRGGKKKKDEYMRKRDINPPPT